MADRTERLIYYNADNNRPQKEFNDEVYALLNLSEPLAKRPALLVLSECVGYQINERKGFVKIRSTKNKSHKNIACYVREDVWGGGLKWHQMKETWTRTNPGASGQHEPRCYPAFKMGTMQIIGVHQPPNGTDNVKASQKEGIDLLTELMKPGPDANDFQKTRPRLALGDYNKRKGEGDFGPDTLAGRIDGKIHGGKIDTCVRRAQGSVSNLDYKSKVNGTTLKSDHGHALVFAFTCDEKWWVPDK
jgi:hypothetical protein